MEMQDYVNRIKLDLTGDVLELEIPDTTIEKFVNNAFKEIQRYIDITNLITVPFASCIDMSDFKYSAVVNVYRTEGITGDASTGLSLSSVDPAYVQMWNVFSNGSTMYNLNSYVLNYASYLTLLQMRNTISTDLAFKEDREKKKLYINKAYDNPLFITIEYVPTYDNVNELESEYWQDILYRLALAEVKVALGRIRTRYSQSNGLWTDDGATILQEGQNELTNLREVLRENSTLFYGVD